MKSIRKRLRSSDLKASRKDKHDSPNFLLKLYQILNSHEYSDIIHWSDTGKYFIVKDLYEFTERVLPQYYKHNNYSSFVRQLNMYDFHKKRSNQNKHTFQHKLFINGQKELIKTIKRKNKKDSFNAVNDNEQALVEYCNEELANKKATKTNLEKALTYLMKSVKESSDKQSELEHKIEKLGKQNEDFLLQNEQMLQEIIAKTEYNKKLEVVVYYILEMTMKKSTIKGTEPKNVLLSASKAKEDNENLLKQIDYSSIQDIIPKASVVKIDSNQNSLKTFIDNYIEKSPNFSSSTMSKSKNDLPMLLTSGEELEKINHLNSIADKGIDHLQAPIIPPSSPLFTHNSNNMSMSPMRYSPRMRKSSFDSAFSMQIEDEVFKNTALRQIISNKMHSNQNGLFKADASNRIDDSNVSIADSMMNSTHSKNIFDLDFNFEENDQNEIRSDKKNANRFFFEYDSLSS